MNWRDFIRSHMAVLAGMDFFTVEVLTWRGLVTYYVLFFLHLETRRVTLAGITPHPNEEWMVQMARNAVDVIDGALLPVRFALHDRDTKFCTSFRTMLQSGRVQPILLPPRSPNLNAFAERWIRSIKGECLSKLILFGETSLRRAITGFITHYHLERPHQGKSNHLLFPSPPVRSPSAHPNRIQCHEALGGLLKFYQRAADLTRLHPCFRSAFVSGHTSQIHVHLPRFHQRGRPPDRVSVPSSSGKSSESRGTAHFLPLFT